jgi:hypothetical protein
VGSEQVEAFGKLFKQFMVSMAPVVDLASVTKKLDFEALEGYELVKKPDTSDPTQDIKNMPPPLPPPLILSREASPRPQMPPLSPDSEPDSPKKRKHYKKKMQRRKPSSSALPSPNEDATRKKGASPDSVSSAVSITSVRSSQASVRYRSLSPGIRETSGLCYHDEDYMAFSWTSYRMMSRHHVKKSSSSSGCVDRRPEKAAPFEFQLPVAQHWETILPSYMDVVKNVQGASTRKRT